MLGQGVGHVAGGLLHQRSKLRFSLLTGSSRSSPSRPPPPRSSTKSAVFDVQDLPSSVCSASQTSSVRPPAVTPSKAPSGELSNRLSPSSVLGWPNARSDLDLVRALLPGSEIFPALPDGQDLHLDVPVHEFCEFNQWRDSQTIAQTRFSGTVS